MERLSCHSNILLLPLGNANEHNTNIHQPTTSCLRPTKHSTLVYAYGIVAIQRVKIKKKRYFNLLERNYGN